MGIGERLHSPLRSIYNKITHTHLIRSKRFVLNIGVKATNDTKGDHGLAASRLLFGIIPSFPKRNPNVPNRRDRMAMSKEAQAEMSSIIADRRVLAALTRDIAPTADRVYNISE